MKPSNTLRVVVLLGLTSCANTMLPSTSISQHGESFLLNPLYAPGTQTAFAGEQPELLIGIGMHIEPQGTTHQGFTGGKGDFSRPEYYELQSRNIQTVVEMINAHGGKVTIQAQSPFTDEVIARNDPILEEMASDGNEIALHFHEDAHLGKNSEMRPIEDWCSAMKEEIDLIKSASGVTEINYWSGGNLYPGIFDAATCAGLSINSDWKNPGTQSTNDVLIGLHPWRPAGGTNGLDFSMISRFDAAGSIIFLPEGLYQREDFASMRRSEDSGGDQKYFEFLKASFLDSLNAAEAGKVNVFHFTIHPGEFRGNPSHPFEVIDDFLTSVVDPLVETGRVKWATFTEMAEAYKAWESAHPNSDMRE